MQPYIVITDNVVFAVYARDEPEAQETIKAQSNNPAQAFPATPEDLYYYSAEFDLAKETRRPMFIGEKETYKEKVGKYQ